MGHSMAVSTSDLVPGPWGNSEAWESQTLADLPFRGFQTSTVGQTATFTKWVMGTRNPHSVPFLKSLREFLFWIHVLLPVCAAIGVGTGVVKGSQGPFTRAPWVGKGCRLSRDAAVTYTCFGGKPSANLPSAHDGVHGQN